MVQVMAWRMLFGDKPLSEPMLKLQWNSNQNTIFYSQEYIWKCPLWYGGHIVQGGDELIGALTVSNCLFH